MPLRVLVLGANGLLGHHVLQAARKDPRFSARATARPAGLSALSAEDREITRLCDVRDEAALAAIIKESPPQVVINCTGITKQLAARPEEVIQLNSLTPHALARIVGSLGGRLIQVSTDCVFSGREGYRREEDPPDPIDLYGRSKLLGEIAYGPHLTVRTSFVGREMGTRRGLLEWFLAQEGRVPGFRRAIWSGLGAAAMARLLLEMARRPDMTGIWHVAGEPVDKYTLLLKLQAAFRKHDVRIEPVDEPVIDRSLVSVRLASAGIRIPSLDEMIGELAGGSDRYSPPSR